MSEATVKAHVSRLLSKLNVTNRVQIAILVRDATTPERTLATSSTQALSANGGARRRQTKPDSLS
jgi:hypothetical protein